MFVLKILINRTSPLIFDESRIESKGSILSKSDTRLLGLLLGLY